jgi:hypothetical protein
LEYDSSAKVVNDTNGTNYCNQWYPADQIAGASSLFDNYREAGYYEPAGRDALFCAVPSDFTTLEERVYCIANSVLEPAECNAIAVVPAGSKINATALSSNSSLVNYSYLKPEVYSYVPAFGNVEDYPTNDGFPNGIGLDRIEKKGSNINSGYSGSKFNAIDFILVPGTKTNQSPVVSLEILNKTFVMSAGQEISVLYFDEDVDMNAKDSINARIWIGDRLEDSTRNDPTGTEGCYDPASGGNTGTEDIAANCDACDSAKTWHSAHNGSATLGQPEHGFCNPLPYNYYLKPVVVSTCTTNCGNAIPKGQACMNLITEYSSLSTDGCFTNFCKFKDCVENTSASGSNLSCASYGQIFYGSRVTNSGVKDVTAVTGCLAHMFSRKSTDPDNPLAVYGLVAKSSITSNLVQQAIGNSTVISDREKFIVEENGSYGCFENIIDPLVPCVSSRGMSDVMTCDYIWTTPGYCNARFKFMASGTTCNDQSCYQQCQIVTQLDPEGDKSWVRTDIWWRNENGVRNNYPSTNTWLSYYYKAGFIQNDKVSYSGITGENVKFTHFGSALGFLANDVVNVRVPVNATVFSPLSAVTFYASEADGISAAHQQLAYLFYRAYNLKWDTGTTSYLPNGNASYAGDNIYTGTITSDGQRLKLAQISTQRFCRSVAQISVSGWCSYSGITINDTQSGNVSGKINLSGFQVLLLCSPRSYADQKYYY